MTPGDVSGKPARIIPGLNKLRLAALALLGLAVSPLLSGCALAWGSGHNIMMENQEGVLIQYDHVITGSGTVARIADGIARKYGRVAVPGDQERSDYPGIKQRYFKFVEPTKTGRTGNY